MSPLDISKVQSTDVLLDNFFDYVNDKQIELYPAQEEAVLELWDNNNVILKTPTGSGKSLVAFAGHYLYGGRGLRSVYTAPIKALVSEKFFSLCAEFGSDAVGMITGDVSINPDAAIVCCTAEILANQVMRKGSATPFDLVVMDEFHYYSDKQRGWAWQLPLLEMSEARFLLMSATLGDTEFFESELAELTKSPTTLVTTDTRPVPLEYEYRKSTLHNSVSDLLDRDVTPIYLVHFTQRQATEAAQNYLSLDPLDKDGKKKIKEIIKDIKFSSPMGKDIKRYISGGVGVHHAGLLPKYRLLVEKLAQDGLLKIICGTDTLGVGVNVPIRSVVLTQLCRYDGESNRILNNREFHQIAGRAGRKGFDDKGFVWVQAPAHVVENEVGNAKVADGSKKKHVNKKPPERGYTHWTKDTYAKIVNGQPEQLKSSFDITHQMLLSYLGREFSGCEDFKKVLNSNHESIKNKRKLKRKAISIYRSLIQAGLITRQSDDRAVVEVDLDDDLALYQPLSLWALTAIAQLEFEHPDYALHVLAVVESILESPRTILMAQTDIAKDQHMAEMKAEGVEYEQRMEKLAEVKHPMPHKEWIWDSFDMFRESHPWAATQNVKPKGVVRELYEGSFDFNTYVHHLKIKRSEGTLLRYLSDAYKALVQTVQSDAQNEELSDLIEWLRSLVKRVDSSLLDEWENLNNVEANPDTVGSNLPEPQEKEEPITDNVRVFTVMVRNKMFSWVQSLAHKRYETLPAGHDYKDLMSDYWDEFSEIMIDGDARSATYFDYDHSNGDIEQILVDEDQVCSWRIKAKVDLQSSAEKSQLVIDLISITSIG